MTFSVAKPIKAAADDCIKIIQITDSHIFAESDGKLLGLNTRQSFEAIVERILQEDVKPDLILATGDLAQDGSEDAYRYLLEKLQAFAVPCFWIPGNHDLPAVMASILNEGHVQPEKRLIFDDWQIVLLDTSVPRKVYGNISDEQLTDLEAAIAEHPNKHLLTVMHHQPVDVGSKWLDGLGIKNAEQLFSAVVEHQAQSCFLWGHVHQDYVGEQQGVKLISTPSTCVQFKPGSEDFSAGDESPGYRYLTLYKDGRVDSVMHRISDIEFTVDYSIKGY